MGSAPCDTCFGSGAPRMHTRPLAQREQGCVGVEVWRRSFSGCRGSHAGVRHRPGGWARAGRWAGPPRHAPLTARARSCPPAPAAMAAGKFQSSRFKVRLESDDGDQRVTVVVGMEGLKIMNEAGSMTMRSLDLKHISRCVLLRTGRRRGHAVARRRRGGQSRLSPRRQRRAGARGARAAAAAGGAQLLVAWPRLTSPRSRSALAPTLNPHPPPKPTADAPLGRTPHPKLVHHRVWQPRDLHPDAR
jgi:hypothetical protein